MQPLYLSLSGDQPVLENRGKVKAGGNNDPIVVKGIVSKEMSSSEVAKAFSSELISVVKKDFEALLKEKVPAK